MLLVGKLFILYLVILHNIRTGQLQTEKQFRNYLMGYSNSVKLVEEQNVQSIRFMWKLLHARGPSIAQNKPCTSIGHVTKKSEVFIINYFPLECTARTSLHPNFHCHPKFTNSDVGLSISALYCAMAYQGNHAWLLHLAYQGKLGGTNKKNKLVACLFCLILHARYMCCTTGPQNHRLQLKYERIKKKLIINRTCPAYIPVCVFLLLFWFDFQSVHQIFKIFRWIN